MPLPSLLRLGSGMRRVALTLLFLATAAGSPLSEGKISGVTVDESPFSSRNEQGRVLLVNFWATWCGPCRAEMPAMDAFYRKHHDEGFDMLAISLDEGLSKRALAGATSRFRFPVARIADMSTLPRSAPTTLPVTWIYARNGSLHYDSALQGKRIMDADTLESIVGPLLRNRPIDGHD